METDPKASKRETEAIRRKSRHIERDQLRNERLRERRSDRFIKLVRGRGSRAITDATRKTLAGLRAPEDIEKEFLPGISRDAFIEISEKIDSAPQEERDALYRAAFGKAFEEAFAGTFGFRGPHMRNTPGDQICFWDQALGCWRLWLITRRGRVHEYIQLTAPPRAVALWENELKKRGHPSLDLRTQPAFHVNADGGPKVVDLPLVIVVDPKLRQTPKSLKTSLVAEDVPNHCRIPLERIWDPCVLLSPQGVVSKRQELLPGYKPEQLAQPYHCLGFWTYASENPDSKFGRACWDWVFSDFDFSRGDDNYLFQQDGDTYTLSLRKPSALRGKEAAAWHADIPYGPLASFARNVNAAFWPPTPPPALDSSGVPLATSVYQEPTVTPPPASSESFALSSVPITRYRSGQPFDQSRMSRHAAHFGIQTPALGDIATHLGVALPAQPSPVVSRDRSTRPNRRTASAMNSPSQY